MVLKGLLLVLLLIFTMNVTLPYNRQGEETSSPSSVFNFRHILESCLYHAVVLLEILSLKLIENIFYTLIVVFEYLRFHSFYQRIYEPF